MDFDKMMEKMAKADGFLAALDQSGGSTPKALKAYGIPDDSYVAGEESMHDMIHAMRSRIITSKSFAGDKVMGAILFEATMDREIEGMPTGNYLWEKKNIIPFLKCDKGMVAEENGCQLMEEMPTLDDLLSRAKAKVMFGTKMRSVVKMANAEGIKAVVARQFKIGKQIIGHGLVPILEPEVDITSPEKEQCEELLKANLLEQLDQLNDDEKVMLKLTLPTKVNLYKELVDHPKCARLVALSGGYSREEANEILAKQTGMIASFSRALAENLNHNQSQDEFDKNLITAVDSILEASKSG